VITPLEAAQFSHAKKFKNVDTTGATQKVLHVEEIQSDWHQKARDIRRKEIERLMKSEGIDKATAQKQVSEDFGYKPADYIKRSNALDKEFNDLGEKRTQLLKQAELMPTHGAEFTNLIDEANSITPKLLKLQEQRDNMRNVINYGVPDAPFKKNWHELAMKRLLNYAAENGYDKIAITPGAEQARRYDLSRYINEISYGKNPDGTYSLTAIDKDGKPAISKSNLSQSELEETVGKDMAKKIVDNQGTEYPVGSVSEGKRALTGLDLQVGGEGKQTIYDKMIPNYLNEFGKKYNVQVSPFDIEQPSATNPNNLTLPSYAPQPVPTMQLHGFDITPEMREEISTQGLPMFSKGGAVFDPEGEDYDYDTAKASGLGATGEGENEGHWGSVTMASEQDKKLHGLPDNSYMLLKGRKHETWSKAENAEKARGSEIVKRGSRYYSIPKINPQKRGGRVHVSQNPDTMLLDLISKN
jgi:hypothetical protein